MKKVTKKAIAWLMIACLFVGFVPLFGSAMAAETAEPASASTKVSASEMNTDGLGAFFSDAMKALADGLRTISVDDILNLPANIMDDVVTYIFAVFKLLGVDIDALYAKLSTTKLF